MKTITTNSGKKATITPTALYPNAVYIAKFEETGGIRIVDKAHTYDGVCIKDYLQPSVQDIGYYGYGGKKVCERVKVLWRNIFARCYCPANQDIYADVTVCERWHSLTNFNEDVISLPGFEEWWNGEEYELDKDMLSGEVKIYSPETCAFIPKSLNRSMGALNKKRKQQNDG